MRRLSAHVISVVLCLLSAAVVAAEEEFSFDVSAFKPKIFELRGYFELKARHLDLNRDGALYQLNFFDQDSRPETLDEATGTAEVEGRYRKGRMAAKFRTHSEATDSKLGIEMSNKLYEGFGSFFPDDHNIIDVGKKTYRWGKGIAWNPVAFVERPKDPADPTLSRQGFWTASITNVNTRAGALQNIGINLLAVPTFGDTNEDFGESGHLNPAAKLSLLYKDTDIDFMVLGKGSRTLRFGTDFSRNLAPNFEIHGELAYFTDLTRSVLSASGGTATETDDVTSYLLGLRYRTAGDVNIVAEYYHNATGANMSDQREFFRRVHEAWDNDDDDTLSRLRDRRQFVRPNPMRDYLYFRSAWREPYDFLYFTPSFFVIGNLNDGSYNWTGELFYEGVDNVELRGRLALQVGDPLTEYGEKRNNWQLELRVRYYF